MNIEKMLAEELHVVADGLAVPRPPINELLREGTRSRNRRRMYAAGLAAAAVAVVSTGLAIAHGDPRVEGPGPSKTSPSPSPTRVVDGLPVGESPMLPWIDANDDLHVGDDVIGGPFNGVSGVEPWVLATISLRDGGDSAWVTIVDGEAELIRRNLSPPGAVSPDGRWWAPIRFEDDGRHSLIRYDSENPDDRPVHDLGQPSAEADGAVGVTGIDNRGRIYSADQSGAIMWVPETDTIVQLGPQIVGVGPAGPMLRDGQGEDPFLTVMADDGTIESQLALPDVVDGTVSPAGTRTAWRTDHRGRDLQRDTLFSGVLDAVTVQELATGQRTTIPLPTGTDLAQVQWEDEDTILLKVTIDREIGTTRFARCDVVTAACEWAVAP